MSHNNIINALSEQLEFIELKYGKLIGVEAVKNIFSKHALKESDNSIGSGTSVQALRKPGRPRKTIVDSKDVAKPLPVLPDGMTWPKESFGGSPEAHTEDGVVKFIERVWQPLIAAGYAERRLVALCDPSVLTGIDTYRRARNGNRELPEHLRFLTVGEAKILRARLEAEVVLRRKALPRPPSPS
jgi:hypothetical protein